MKTNKKLVLKKEKVASLSDRQMGYILGGNEAVLEEGTKSSPSSVHPKFTCCWCSFGNTETPKTKK